MKSQYKIGIISPCCFSSKFLGIILQLLKYIVNSEYIVNSKYIVNSARKKNLQCYERRT